MSMMETLRDGYSRRVLLALSLIALILCFSLMFALLRHEGKSVSESVDELSLDVGAGLIGSIVTAGFLILVVRLVSRREVSLSMVEAATPAVTARLHNAELISTSIWLHDGHIGRWVRSSALPNLAARSRATGGRREVVVLILNPLDADLCEEYARYRQILGTEQPSVSHLVDTRSEIIATCAASVFYEDRHPGLNIDVRFRSEMRYERVDITSDIVFMTLADPKCNSVIVRRHNDQDRHGFYEAMRSSFDLMRNASQPFVNLCRDDVDLGHEEGMRRFIEVNFPPLAAVPGLVQQSTKVYKSDWNPFR